LVSCSDAGPGISVTRWRLCSTADTSVLLAATRLAGWFELIREPQQVPAGLLYMAYREIYGYLIAH
jgi:hypothetical protein